MQLDKLPKLTQTILEDYLMPLYPRASIETLVLAILFGISKILCHNRVTIHNDEIQTRDTFPNIYAMAFMKSGEGKDITVKTMKDLLSKFESGCREEFADWHEQIMKEVEFEIEEKGLTKTKAYEFRENNAPRYLKMNIDSSSTFEGFLAQRQAFDRARFGCTYWADGEIYDTIQSKNPSVVLFKKANKEAYDHGENQDKVIKSVKKPCDIERVPHLMYLYGAIDSEEKEDSFRSFFNMGFARRTLVAMPNEQKKFERIDRETKRKNRNIANSNLKTIQGFLNEIADRVKLKREFLHGGNKEFTLTDEAVQKFTDYEEDCAESAFKMKSVNNEGIVVEIKNRPWKMLKLSCVIAVQTKAEFVINGDDIDIAIYLVEYYGKQFAEFYKREHVSLTQKVIAYMKDKGAITKGELRDSKVISGTQGEKTSKMKSLFEGGALKEALALMDCMLITTYVGKKKNAKAYSIMKDVGDYIGYIKDNKGKTSLEDMEREFGKGIKTILESDPTVDKGVNDNYFII